MEGYWKSAQTRRWKPQPAPRGLSLQWHRAEAERAEGSRFWSTAAEHLSPLIAADPANPELRRRRGAAYAGMARWSHAARDYAAALSAGERRYPEWYRTALIQLGAGDRIGYRKTCTGMLNRFTSGEQRARDITAWTCALSEPHTRDLERAIRMAQALLQVEPENDSYRETLGALLLRGGKWRDSHEHLRRAADRRGADVSAVTLFLLSMAEAHLGYSADARSTFARARETEARANGADGPWEDRLERRLLQSQAERVIRL